MEAGEALANVEARAATYSFLSGMFLREVSQDFLERLAAEPPHLGGELERFAVGLATADLSTVRRDAAAEFAALLLGMSADPVHPYESVYTSPERLMMQDARDEVLALYRSQGLGRVGDLNIPEDHAGIELEFMARLCRKELDAMAEGDEGAVWDVRRTQQTFVRDHLLVWMPRMCDDLEARAKSGLYRGLAQTTRRFLSLEREELDAG